MAVKPHGLANRPGEPYPATFRIQWTGRGIEPRSPRCKRGIFPLDEPPMFLSKSGGTANCRPATRPLPRRSLGVSNASTAQCSLCLDMYIRVSVRIYDEMCICMPQHHSVAKALSKMFLALLSLAAASLAQTSLGATTSAQQKMALRYFEEVLDAGKVETLEDLILPDCTIHRPEGELKGLSALRSMVAARRANFSSFKTQVHELIESGDRVVVRLTHEGTALGPYRFRIGTRDISNKTMTWEAIVIFRFANGKIAEEWVSRDELGMLLSAGVLQRADSVP